MQVRGADSGAGRGAVSWSHPPFRPDRVSHFTLTRDGNAVAARFDRSDRVLVWSLDPRTGRFAMALPEILQHANGPGNVSVVSSIVAGPGASQLVTTESYQSKAASLWDAAGQRLFRVPMQEQVFRAAAGKERIAVADRSGLVRVVSVPRRADAAAFRVGGMPSLLALDREDRMLFVAWTNAGSHRACLYDLAASPLACRAVALGGAPVQALFSPRGRYLAVAEAGGIRGGRTVLLDGGAGWTSRPLASDSLVHHLAFSGDERFLAAAHDQRGVSLFATPDGAQTAEIPVGAQLKTIALLADAAQTLVTLSEDQLLQAWRWKPPDVIQEACRRWPVTYRPSALPGTTPIPPRDQLCAAR
jgi:hypothetical protein